MTSTAVRNSTALSVPPTQNTAPVHEFRCLYTHDVRKKSKKWQDGRVKYHTFNKRVMLYDDTLHFIGDTHWKESADLQDGDQVSLDAGVLITLEELLVTTQTDLGPLFEKNKSLNQPETSKAPIRRAAPSAAAAVSGTLAAQKLRSMQPQTGDGNRQKHRSLSALLNTNRGTYGKAVLPAQSPYEARKANQENEWGGDREAKRQRIGGADHTNEITTPSNSALVRTTKPAGGRLISKQIVDVTSDDEIPRSDITLPSSPKLPGTAVRTAIPLLEASNTKTTSLLPKKNSPAFIARPASPPISTKSKIRHAEAILSDQAEDTTADNERRQNRTPTIAKTKTLRLGKTQARPMLFCQKKSKPAAETEKVQKKRKTNIYKSLYDSDTDDDISLKAMPPPTKKKAVARSPHKEAIVISDASSSSTAAFDTGQSSSPRRTAVRRGELLAPGRLPKEKGFIFSDLDDETLEMDTRSIVGKMTGKDESLGEKINEGIFVAPKHSVAGTAELPTKAKKPKKSPMKTMPPKSKKSPAKATAAKGKKSLKTIIEKSNEAASDVVEGMGTRAMEEQAKALAAGGPQREQGAWTVEATDLFDWRPPDWQDRAKRMGLAS